MFCFVLFSKLPVNFRVRRQVVEALVAAEHLELLLGVSVVDEDALVLAAALEEGAHVGEVDGGVGGKARIDDIVVVVGVQAIVHVATAPVYRVLHVNQYT